MREIDFRAKDVVSLKWVYGVPVKFSVNCGHEHIELVEKIEYETDLECSTFIHSKAIRPETLGQYIGLKDNNGTKIFDGDIVIVNGDVEDLAVIQWDNDMVMFIVKMGDILYDFDNLYGRDLEVIGNIYDTPELLEVNHD